MTKAAAVARVNHGTRTRALHEVIVVETKKHSDERGYFVEMWNQSRTGTLGVPKEFVQDNVSWSRYGVIRGLHAQHPHGQGKLVSVLLGEIYDVAVDVRYGSPTFGKWFGVTLSNTNGLQVYVPGGFAHGFCVVSEAALVGYKCTRRYRQESEISIAWNDPAIGIEWPITEPILSAKDKAAFRLDRIPIVRLPKWKANV
jgi:dTDP-4-dehydrorhamnose 3,5-epimerase